MIGSSIIDRTATCDVPFAATILVTHFVHERYICGAMVVCVAVTGADLHNSFTVLLRT